MLHYDTIKFTAFLKYLTWNLTIVVLNIMLTPLGYILFYFS